MCNIILSTCWSGCKYHYLGRARQKIPLNKQRSFWGISSLVSHAPREGWRIHYGTIVIGRGYITRPRSHRRHKVFREHSELLVMSALYILATGAAFCCCKPLCSISTSEVRKFFYIFIEALVEMKDEYIYIPRNITELQPVNRDYKRHRVARLCWFHGCGPYEMGQLSNRQSEPGKRGVSNPCVPVPHRF